MNGAPKKDPTDGFCEIACRWHLGSFENIRVMPLEYCYDPVVLA